jgi:hypothetical protein
MCFVEKRLQIESDSDLQFESQVISLAQRALDILL